MFVVASDSGGLSDWKHAGKLGFAEFAFEVSDVSIAHEAGPSSFDGEWLISYLIFIEGVVEMFHDDFSLFEFLIEIGECFFEAVPIWFFLHIHFESIYFSCEIVSKVEYVFFESLKFDGVFIEFFFEWVEFLFKQRIVGN